MPISRGPCAFVPPWLLERLGTDPGHDEELRRRRERLSTARPSAKPSPPVLPTGVPVPWTVHTAAGSTRLPGAVARVAGAPPTGDLAVDEAAAGITATLAMWADGLSRASYDGLGTPVSLSVHYGRDYDNAFWNGEQLVFGDGDGVVFERFTKPIDVLAHEFGHAVTEHTAGLVYGSQSGALNESVSDAFAACLKQRVLGQDAAAGDWLIGEGLFTPGVSARALRDMAAPGTAFDDPRLGKDPQVAHLDDYVQTTEDNGGVHINSGIPNRAFQLAAVAIGGSALDGAGRIWYDALSGGMGPDTDFAGFAAATVATAGAHRDAVRDAWAAVGVDPTAASRPPVSAPVVGGVLRVTRSGGFGGITMVGELDLSDRHPAMQEIRELLARADLAAARGATPKPDMFVYTFQVGDTAPVRVLEQNLSHDLAALARAVLEQGHT